MIVLFVYYVVDDQNGFDLQKEEGCFQLQGSGDPLGIHRGREVEEKLIVAKYTSPSRRMSFN